MLVTNYTTGQKYREEIHKAAGMINNQYSKHRDDMETATENSDRKTIL